MLLNYNVYGNSLDAIELENVRIINTINPHSYCLSKQDKEFELALKKSDILLPDGIGIVWASKVLRKEKIKKIAGYDLLLFVMDYLNRTNGTCFFLGSTPTTLALIKNRTKVAYPNVKLEVYSPPFKPEFSELESSFMCKKINEFQPTVLFVGMTAPKQEKWVESHKEHINAKIISSIGAAFDFYAGTVERSSPVWINMGLEWLPRLLKEPRRLYKRNLVSTPKFILEVISFKLLNKGMLGILFLSNIIF